MQKANRQSKGRADRRVTQPGPSAGQANNQMERQGGQCGGGAETGDGRSYRAGVHRGRAIDRLYLGRKGFRGLRCRLAPHTLTHTLNEMGMGRRRAGGQQGHHLLLPFFAAALPAAAGAAWASTGALGRTRLRHACRWGS